LHLDLRTALHDDGVRTGRARGARRWRKHELRIGDWCLAGSWFYERRDELWDHHNLIGFHPAAPRAPSEERLPNEAVRSPKSRSHTALRRDEARRHEEVRRYENDAGRAGRANHDRPVSMKVAVEVAVKSVASVETVGATASTSMTPCEAWRGRNEKERNRQEECRNYWSHAANSAERVNPHATRVSTAIAIHPGSVASVIRGRGGFPIYLLGRCGELHKGPAGVLSAGTYCEAGWPAGPRCFR